MRPQQNGPSSWKDVCAPPWWILSGAWKLTTSIPATSGTFLAAILTRLPACLGDQPCHFILIFDNGYFSEFGTFSITDWLGHASKDLLAKNFGLPAATFDGFPMEEAYFVRGPITPEDVSLVEGALTSPPETHKYRLLAQEPHSIHKFGREWRVGA